MDNLEVRVHSEITSYTEKFYGLTVRQWVAIVLSLFCDIPLFIMLKDFVNSDILQILIVIITAPILAVGFIKVQELTFEEFFVYFKRSYLNLYKPLKYQSDKDYALEKEYYKTLSFSKKVNYLINKDKANDIPINDRIKMEGKEKTLSKKEIKQLKELEKRKIKAQQKIDKQKKKEEKKLRKMYQKKAQEEQELQAQKVLEETQSYTSDISYISTIPSTADNNLKNKLDNLPNASASADFSISTSFENDFIKEKEDLKENFYYMDEDANEEQLLNNQFVPSSDTAEITSAENTSPTQAITDEIKAKEEEIKNLKNKEEYKDSQIDLSAIMNSFTNN